MNPLHLADDEVHLWCVPLDVPVEETECLHATLSSEERARSARFRFERDRRRFVVAHGALRDLLGRYLAIDPGQVRFVVNQFGRPELSTGLGSRLRFNLSHSADLALIAVAAGVDIGVDVEHIRPGPDYSEIARHFFSADEVRELDGVPRHRHAEAFFRCWTQKEAYVKARGEGFEIPLAGLSVSRLHDEWWLSTLQPAPGYVGALAIEGKGWRLSQRQWEPGPLSARSEVQPLSLS